MAKQQEHEISFFQNVERYFDKAAVLLPYDKGLLSQIKGCNSVYQMRYPVKVTDKKTGKERNTYCYRKRPK